MYSYFNWSTPEKTEDGAVKAISDLALIAGLARPAGDSNILPILIPTYKALGLDAPIAFLAENAKSKHGTLLTAVGKEDEEAFEALLAFGHKDNDDEDGSMALIKAVKMGLISFVDGLLAAGADKDARDEASLR